jgi:hypothetical protein
MEKIIVAKWKNRIYQIIRVVDTVAFSKEKEWILLSNQINKKDSIQVKWVRVKDVRFDWIREFNI